MSGHYYDWIDSGGSTGSGELNVYVYPYSPDEESICDDGGMVAETLATRGENLLDDDAINYYSVYRFESENNRYPEDYWYGGLDDDDIFKEEFKEFLKYDNGTGDNLYSLQGVHLLVHPGSGCDETDGYAPDGANVEHGLAFDEGVAAWSPVCAYNSGLTKNAAIQETLHAYIEDNSYTDEHANGTISESGYNRYAVSPMLTYHWDDDINGCNGDDADSPDEYRQWVTDCTTSSISSSW